MGFLPDLITLSGGCLSGNDSSLTINYTTGSVNSSHITVSNLRMLDRHFIESTDYCRNCKQLRSHV